MANESQHASTVQLVVEFSPEEDLDQEELDEMTQGLRMEMEEMPYVESIGVASASGPAQGLPEGAKAGALLTLGKLAMQVVPTAVPACVGFLKDWTLRPGTSPIKIRVQHADRSTEIEYDPRSMSQEDIKELAANMHAILKP
jgi:hypothetical protein